MQGTVPGGRRRGRPKKCWHDNIKEWTDLPLDKTLRLAEDKDGWRKIINTSVVPLQPPQLLRAADGDTRKAALERPQDQKMHREDCKRHVLHN